MRHNYVYMKRLFTSILLASACVCAQPQQPPPVISPEVHGDHSVTFRLRAPNAKAVLLSLEGADRKPMEKDDQGIWSLTTGPLEPDLYGYLFIVDGVGILDPGTWRIKPNLLSPQSVVYVPGPSSLPWEINDVPHGTVDHRFYHSHVIGDDRDYYVYTPPGYDPTAKKLYPLFYLLHGYSDDASGWTAVGRANIILDNLIAQGKAKPMIIVMTLGYGAPEIVTRGFSSFNNAGLVNRNYTRYRDALFTEVMPAVEKEYRVAKDRRSRAIAGLSMGGAESLFVGLNALDRFAYIGAFSAGGMAEDYAEAYPNLDSKANQQIKLLWIACGAEDRLIDANRKFRDWLKSKGVEFTPIETPGMHTWMVWRRNLAAFAPLLFQ